jgi:hypothetical protein
MGREKEKSLKKSREGSTFSENSKLAKLDGFLWEKHGSTRFPIFSFLEFDRQLAETRDSEEESEQRERERLEEILFARTESSRSGLTLLRDLDS